MAALELVTQAEAIAQLRLDEGDSTGSPDGPWLSIWIPAISEAVRSWLKDDARLYVPARDENGDVMVDSSGEPVPELDSSGDPTVNPIVKGAVLVELASQYRYREGEGSNAVPQDNVQYGYTLSAAATSLLRGLRKPTVA
jgi:hypothetical protein